MHYVHVKKTYAYLLIIYVNAIAIIKVVKVAIIDVYVPCYCHKIVGLISIFVIVIMIYRIVFRKIIIVHVFVIQVIAKHLMGMFVYVKANHNNVNQDFTHVSVNLNKENAKLNIVFVYVIRGVFNIVMWKNINVFAVYPLNFVLQIFINAYVKNNMGVDLSRIMCVYVY